MVWHRWGDPSAPPVLLLHGGAGSWTHWARNLPALLAAGHQVLAPDLPGFGDSDRPPRGQDADVLPPFVEAGLRQALGEAACEVVAFSFGAMVAGLLAAGWPARVRRLVLVGAPALLSGGLAPLALRAWSPALPPGEREAVLRHNLQRLMLARPEAIDALALRLHADNLARDRMKLRRLSRTDLLHRTLPAVRCPVHGIWGAEDALYRGRIGAVAPALAAAPDFRGLVLLPGAGHWAPYEDAPAFDAALAQVLGLEAMPRA
ncbi:2-hydroxy-6-oxo-6-phenylhexa-2,4-dienoate hydrolase [Piscinibacter sakaiensis]|uniref:2-hydroxy-6-oxo-6-phenylhexa-2,4-dienoate hydrolase n=2 Tax=Piscinibacter sakaiensis TaxID=1547922 RepID=A0A0K8P0A3_PISS1|nr:2-hydroxy-6-oxo-6-phenylhexa-2,4-dienoate hydrolase [Piscinibacter sakaiensis]